MEKKRTIRIGLNSPVILGFTALCVLAYLVNLLTKGASNYLLFTTRPASMLDPLTYVRAVGHCIGHASWDHLFGNLSLILLLGPMVEEKYGSANTIFVMLCTAIVTAAVNALFGGALLGASGVVFAFILLSSITGFEKGTIPLTFILVAIIYLGQEIYTGLTVQDGVSQLGHVIGGVVGSALGFVMNRMRMNRYLRSGHHV